MQRVSLYIDTDNAAFDDMQAEVGRIVRELGEAIERGAVAIEDGAKKPLRDVNGNRVGAMVVEGNREGDDEEEEKEDGDEELTA